MSNVHTPGPWQFYADLPSVDPNWHIVTSDNRMRVIANVHIEPGNAMDLANARLITAAPELLEALELCTANWGVRDVFLLPAEKAALDLARAAIAKAKGVK